MNKAQQSVITTATLVITIFCFTLFFSCKKDSKVNYNSSTNIQPCANVTCLNGGTCLNGVCMCTAGFEGTNCATTWSQKFIGSYTANDNCYTSNTTNTVVISSVTSMPQQLKINNLGVMCPGATISAIINPEKTSFYIPVQNVCGNNYISGNGNKNENSINIFLQSRDTILHTSTNCSIILNK